MHALWYMHGDACSECRNGPIPWHHTSVTHSRSSLPTHVAASQVLRSTKRVIQWGQDRNNTPSDDTLSFYDELAREKAAHPVFDTVCS